MRRLFVGLGGLAGLGAVGMAAYAAHAGLAPAAQAALGSAVQMQGWHALALLACAVLPAGRLVSAAALCFAVGMALFCGALYASALGGIGLGRVAPTGGVLMMAGWALLAASSLRRAW